MCSGSGTTFECRKNRSSRDSRKPGEAAFDRAPQDPFDLLGCSLAEIAFAGDPRTLGEPAGKRGADHLLRLAIAVARREVEQGNAGLDRFMYRGDAFRETGLAPQHAEPAAAKRQDRHRRQPTETVLPHLIDTPSYRVSVYASFRKLGEPGKACFSGPRALLSGIHNAAARWIPDRAKPAALLVRDDD
jgi:hypothetical protein